MSPHILNNFTRRSLVRYFLIVSNMYIIHMRMNGDSNVEEENLNDLPTSLKKIAEQGDEILKHMETRRGQLIRANDDLKVRIALQLFIIVIAFLVTLLFYFFAPTLFLDTIFMVFVIFVLNLVVVAYTSAFSMNITVEGDFWTTFKSNLLYDLRHLNSYIDMRLKKEEHRVDIEQFRDKTRFTLNKFGVLDLPGMDDVVNNFMSSSETESMWIEEISDLLEQLGILKSVFKLMFYEPTFDKNEMLFKEVKSYHGALELFKNILVGNSIIRTNPVDVWGEEALDYILKTTKVFKLESLRSDLDKTKSEISQSISTARNVITTYFPFKVVNDLTSIGPPSDFRGLDQHLIEAISKTYSTQVDVISFLYYSTSPSTINGLKIAQELKTKEGFLEELIEFLIRESVILSNSCPSDLALILKSMDYFKPDIFQSRISNYEDVLVLSREFRNFIYNIGTEENYFEAKTSEIFEICNSTQNKLERIVKVSSLIVREFEFRKSDYIYKKPNQNEIISQSLLLLFLFKFQSPLLREACISASSVEDTVGILYRYAILSDTERTSSEDIDKLVLKAIENYNREDSINDRYFLPFKKALSVGVLYTSIMALDSYEMAQIQEEVHNVEKKLSNISILEVFKQSLKDLLENTLIGEKIESLLEYGTVNAFILTKDSLSKGKVWDLVEDVTNKNGLILGARSGNNTRYGLIPRNTTFESFAKKFKEMYNNETSKQGNERIFETATLNLFKFVPSKSYTSAIGVSRYSIFQEIGNLLRGENIPQDEKISLLASLEGHADTKKSVGEIIYTAINRIDIIDFTLELSRNDGLDFRVFSDLSRDKKRKLAVLSEKVILCQI